MSGLSNKVVGLTVAVILIGALLSVGIMFVVEANTTGWSTTQTTIWNILPLIIVVGALLLILGYVQSRR